MGKFVDLTNIKHGLLTPLQVSGTYNKSGTKVWKCLCDCGVYVNVKSTNLRNGKSTHCGCRKSINLSNSVTKDITGQRFARLLVIKRVANKGKNVMWECLCDCGISTVARGTGIRAGEIKSCGCLGDENRKTASVTHGKSYTREYRRALTNAYRQRCRNATPFWVDKVLLKQVYANCPHGYEVDHVVPLKGENVCGLHIPSNLQYLVKSENRSKTNKFNANQV